MSNQEPTPRQWAAETFIRPLAGELANVVSITYQRQDGGCRYVADLLPTWGGDGPPPPEVAANAALIVRAVNYHDALVSALFALVRPMADNGDVDDARALLAEIEGREVAPCLVCGVPGCPGSCIDGEGAES